MQKPNLGILLKPASSDCNVDCDYCYYRYVDGIYPDQPRHRMPLEVVDAVCGQYLALGPREMKLGWQGGEPTLMGLKFFEEAVEIQRTHARRGQCFSNSLQTNGLVLDERWGRFLAANNFLVGLSVDGTAEMNRFRRLPNGKPTHAAAMAAIELLKKHRVEFNVLIVISAANVDRPAEVFEFVIENDIHYVQLIPCTEPDRDDGGLTEHSITAEQYADFMISFFDAWTENDDPSYYVRRIDNWLHMFFGLPPECCEYRSDCSDLVTIEYNGDVYPCDFFVRPEFRMGNVLEDTLGRMLRGRAFRAFVRGAESYPAVCRGCEWLELCHGGCYRHREKLGLGEDEKPYLCEAKKRIFSHVFGRLAELKDSPVRPRLHRFLIRLASETLAPIAGQGGRPQQAQGDPGHPLQRGAPGRNDPCPCGSGRKFKSCCMGRHSLIRKG